MVGWHHWLNRHKFEQVLGDGEGQGSLGCFCPWGHKGLDTSEWLTEQQPGVSLLSIISLLWYIWIYTNEIIWVGPPDSLRSGLFTRKTKWLEGWNFESHSMTSRERSWVWNCCCWLVTKSCPILCDPLNCMQHARLLCPSLSPEVSSGICPLSWWCHPTISSSAILLSFCLQSLPESETFPMSQLFKSGSQSIGAPASASALPMNIQGLFPLAWTGFIPLQSKGFSRIFSNSSIQKHQFFGA